MTDLTQFEVTALYPSAKGGQHVGLTHLGIKVKHIPTGIYCVCEYERSQHKNRKAAMAAVEMALAEIGWKE